MDIRKLVATRGVEGALYALAEALAPLLEKDGKDVDDHGQVVDKTPTDEVVEEVRDNG